MQAHDYGLKYFKNKTNFQGLVVFSDKEQNQFESTLPSSPNIYIEIEKVDEDSNNWLLHLNSRLSGDYGDFFAANKPPFGEINESEYNFDQEKFSVLQGFVVDAPNGMIPYYKINEKLYLKVNVEIQLDEVFLEATRKADIEVKPSETVAIEYDAYISLFVSSNGAKLERAYQNITNIKSNEVVILIESNEGSNVFGTVLRIHKGKNVKTLPEVDRLTISKIAKAYGVTIETHDLTAIIKEELVDNKSAFYISVTKSLKYGGRVIRWTSDEILSGVSAVLKSASHEVNELKLNKSYWQTEIKGKPNKDFGPLLPKLKDEKERIDTKALINSIYKTYVDPLTKKITKASKDILESKFIRKVIPFNIDKVIQVLNKIPELLQDFFDDVADQMTNLYYFINGLLVGLINSIIEFVKSIFDILAMLFDVLNATIKSTKFFDNPATYLGLFVESFENLIDGFVSLFTLDNLKSIIGFAASLPAFMTNILIAFIKSDKKVDIDPGALGYYFGFFVGFVASEVVTFFLTGGTGTVAKALKATLQSYKALAQMPLKAAKNAGKLVGKTVEFGIDTFMKLVDIITDFVKNIPKHIDTLKGWIDEFIASLQAKVLVIDNVAFSVVDPITALGKLFVNVAGKVAWKKLSNLGVSMIKNEKGVFAFNFKGKNIKYNLSSEEAEFFLKELFIDVNLYQKQYITEYLDELVRVARKSKEIGLDLKTMSRKYLGENYDYHPYTRKYSEFHPDNVIYFDEIGKRKSELFIKDNRLVDSKGRFFDSLDIDDMMNNGKAIFVMDENGRIFASKYYDIGVIHHSSFLRGGPVAMAGEIEVYNGYIVSVNNATGHYKTWEKHIKQFITFLKNKGVTVEDIKIDVINK
ncbi:hypothetical protein [Tenacibaculum xiamenense]|uniref:hypothetical protein n=1 Tax=Tenacibaculum xiamenense TaxID=1261553 RepID=UPI003894CB8F